MEKIPNPIRNPSTTPTFTSEAQGEMAEMTAPLLPKSNNNNLKNPSSAGEMELLRNPKMKAELDRTSVKYILDQTAIKIITKKGFVPDILRREENVWNLFGGALLIGIGLFAQFYPEQVPFEIPEKKLNVLCFMHYYYGILLLVRFLMARQVLMFTYPPKFRCTGLAVSSKLSRSSDLYTLIIASAEAVSSWENPPVKLTKSFTEWFACDGVLLEDLYSKDVEGLVSDYVKESNKRGMWGSLLLWGVSVFFPIQMSIPVSCIHSFWMTFFVLKLVKAVQ